jgi:hypothetical protein
MKTKPQLVLLLSFLTGLSLPAQDFVLIQAKVIETEPRVKLTKADCKSKAGLEKRGVHVLSTWRGLVESGTPVKIFVGQLIPVDGLETTLVTNVHVGVELNILPTVEGDSIKYLAHALVRKHEHSDATRGQPLAEFSARECYYSGSCKNGESVLLSSRGLQDNRKLYLHLAFTQQADPSLPPPAE